MTHEIKTDVEFQPGAFGIRSWKKVLAAFHALEIGGKGMIVAFDNPHERHLCLMAMRNYGARHANEYTLFIRQFFQGDSYCLFAAKQAGQ
jgi:hypothetical protein